MFFDARGQERVLRVTWHDGTLVLSLWRGEMCTASFRMPMDDVGRLLDTLDDGYTEAGGEYVEGEEEDYGEEAEHADQPEYPEYPGTGQYARPAGVPDDVEDEYTQALPYPEAQVPRGRRGGGPREQAVPVTLGPKDVLVARGGAAAPDKLVASHTRPAEYASQDDYGPRGVPQAEHLGPSDYPAQPDHSVPPEFAPRSEFAPQPGFPVSPEFPARPDHAAQSEFAPRSEFAPQPGYPGDQGSRPAQALGLAQQRVPQQASPPPGDRAFAPLPATGPQAAAASDHGVNPDYTPPSGFSFTGDPAEQHPRADYGAHDEYAPRGQFGPQGEFGPQTDYGASNEYGRPGHGSLPEYGSAAEFGPQGEFGSRSDFAPASGASAPFGAPGPNGEFGPSSEFAPRDDYGPRDAHAPGGEFGSQAGHGRPVDPFAPIDYTTPPLDYSAPPAYGSSPDFPPLPEYGGASRYGGGHNEAVPRENMIVNDSLPYGQAGYGAPGEPPGYEWSPQVPAQSAVDPSDPLGLGSMPQPSGDSTDPQLSRPYVHDPMYTTGERVHPDGRPHPDGGGPRYPHDNGRDW
ncbi:hypothetical protein GCM10022226_17560 [Sphaerisporangium flaviroseum]|uniref:Uncharacterized protein n=1 Tax=Sphaerisporangium flaviroseum TaxID=509199 RepID=A0ABP7HN87_9ACTN